MKETTISKLSEILAACGGASSIITEGVWTVSERGEPIRAFRMGENPRCSTSLLCFENLSVVILDVFAPDPFKLL